MSSPFRGRKRTRPMKLLCLGMSRSGTESLCKALTILGFENVYHGFHAITDPIAGKLWLEAVQAKFENFGEKEWGREEFDWILGDCDAVTDFPAAMFPVELIQAYPEAKVILNTRDFEKWFGSFERTMLKSRENLFLGVLAWFSRDWSYIRRPWVKLIDYKFRGNFRRNARVVYEEHNAMAKGAVGNEKGRFQEYEVKDGWGPLCEFLEVGIPEEEFPSGNAKIEFEQNQERLIRPIAGRAMRNMMICGGTLFVAVAYGIWEWMR